MKYSLNCVDKALNKIIPGCTDFPGVGRTTLLEMAAKQCFLYPEKFKTNFYGLLAEHIVRTALIELTTLGYMEFGDVDEL